VAHRGRTAAARGDFSLNGVSASLLKSTSGRHLTCERCDLSVLAEPAVLRCARRLLPTPYALAYARLDGGLAVGSRLNAFSHPFSVGPGDTVWAWARALTPGIGGLALAGRPAALRYSGEQLWRAYPTHAETWSVIRPLSEAWTPAPPTSEIWK
jgi:hypothetical protein